jgi:hypothetical protein
MVMGCSCTSAVSRLVATQVWTSIAHTRSVAAIELKLKEEEEAIAACLLVCVCFLPRDPVFWVDGLVVGIEPGFYRGGTEKRQWSKGGTSGTEPIARDVGVRGVFLLAK